MICPNRGFAVYDGETYEVEQVSNELVCEVFTCTICNSFMLLDIDLLEFIHVSCFDPESEEPEIPDKKNRYSYSSEDSSSEYEQIVSEIVGTCLNNEEAYSRNTKYDINYVVAYNMDKEDFYCAECGEKMCVVRGRSASYFRHINNPIITEYVRR